MQAEARSQQHASQSARPEPKATVEVSEVTWLIIAILFALALVAVLWFYLTRSIHIGVWYR